MRKNVLPEQLNYHKFPGPTFLHFGDVVKSEAGDIQFTLVHNEKDAFNPETFGQRFSEWLLTYDYLVGDWASDQLRIKGFYKDSKASAKFSRFSRITEYLKEYCAFGCAYFILENQEPVNLMTEEESSSQHKRRHQQKSSKTSKANTSSPKETSRKPSFKKKTKAVKAPSDKDSVSQHQGRSKHRSSKQNPVKPATSSQGQHFIIRQKS